MIVNDLYLSCPVATCFDDETLVVDTGEGAGEVVKPPEGFTAEQQKKFNEAIASERRKEEAKYKTALTKTETNLKSLLADSTTRSDKERLALEENLATVQGQLRTKEQTALLREKELESTYQTKLTDAEKRADAAESRYRDSTVTRALQDAAITNDAFNPSQIVTLLKASTKLVDDLDGNNKPTGRLKVVVEFPDKSTTGEDVMFTGSPEDAVKRLREKHESANLFKNNVVSGLGANSSTGGLTPGSNGRVDLRNLTPAQYREIREKQPELLGLRPRNRR